MHRLFIAIRPPEHIIDALIDSMEGVENARWQSEEQLHLTLRYIGEVERPQAEDIAQMLSRLEFAPFDLEVSGVGYFEKKATIHTLWAGIAPCPALVDLQKKVEQICQRAGLPAETRKFSPHITLARLNQSCDEIAPWLAKNGALCLPAFTADRIALCESHLSQNGSYYEDIARFSASNI